MLKTMSMSARTYSTMVYMLKELGRYQSWSILRVYFPMSRDIINTKSKPLFSSCTPAEMLLISFFSFLFFTFFPLIIWINKQILVSLPELLFFSEVLDTFACGKMLCMWLGKIPCRAESEVMSAQRALISSRKFNWHKSVNPFSETAT